VKSANPSPAAFLLSAVPKRCEHYNLENVLYKNGAIASILTVDGAKTS